MKTKSPTDDDISIAIDSFLSEWMDGYLVIGYIAGDTSGLPLMVIPDEKKKTYAQTDHLLRVARKMLKNTLKKKAKK
jgi:hypothetical protein